MNDKLDLSPISGNHISCSGFYFPVFGLLIVLFAASLPVAHGEVLARYTFDGSSDASSDLQLNSNAANFTAGSGLGGTTFTIVGNIPNNGFTDVADRGNPQPSRYALGGSFANSSANSFSGNDYFSFQVTANPGYLLNLNGSSLTFDALNTGGTSASYELRSNLNINSILASGAIGTSFSATPFTYNMTGAQWDGLSSIEFRLYMWGSGFSGFFAETITFDNVTLNGTVVPEPISVALAAFGTCALGIGAGRRYLRRRST